MNGRQVDNQTNKEIAAAIFMLDSSFWLFLAVSYVIRVHCSLFNSMETNHFVQIRYEQLSFIFIFNFLESIDFNLNNVQRMIMIYESLNHWIIRIPYVWIKNNLIKIQWKRKPMTILTNSNESNEWNEWNLPNYREHEKKKKKLLQSLCIVIEFHWCGTTFQG